jgi:hypothetical protein
LLPSEQYGSRGRAGQDAAGDRKDPDGGCDEGARRSGFCTKLSDVGEEPGLLSGEAFGAFLHGETEKWGKVVKDSGTAMQ